MESNKKFMEDWEKDYSELLIRIFGKLRKCYECKRIYYNGQYYSEQSEPLIRKTTNAQETLEILCDDCNNEKWVKKNVYNI